MRQTLRAGLVMVAIVLSTAAMRAQNAAIGTWDMTVTSPISETKSTLVIREDGGVLKAFAKNDQGERPYDKIEVAGTTITMVLTISYEGSPMVITYTGSVEKGKMGGDADFGGLATGSWSASAQ
jgi:hypothetical protein